MPRFNNLLGGLPGFSEYSTAKVFHSERMQNKISRGKRHLGQSLEETRCMLPSVLPQWSHTGCAKFILHWTVVTPVKCCLSGKLIGDSASRLFTGAWSYRHFLHSIHRKSQTSRKKKQKTADVQPKAYGLHSLGTRSNSGWGEPTPNPPSQTSCKGRPCKQTSLGWQLQLCYLNPFLPSFPA